MTKDEILVIKSEIEMSSAERSLLARNIRRQMEEIGAVILPPYLEPLIVPADLEIRIEAEDYGPGEDASPRKAGGVVLT